jgi:hypothetical protein
MKNWNEQESIRRDNRVFNLIDSLKNQEPENRFLTFRACITNNVYLEYRESD